jgi:hypothetical protein
MVVPQAIASIKAAAIRVKFLECAFMVTISWPVYGQYALSGPYLPCPWPCKVSPCVPRAVFPGRGV